MKYLKTVWKTLSPLETPLQADSIFGHLCWAMRYLEGEDSLELFLKAYGKEPPLLVSDGMPSGKLPVPLLVPSLPDKEGTFDIKQAIEHKKLSKIRWIDEHKLDQIRNSLSSIQLFNLLDLKDLKNGSVKEIVSHNSIDRLTDRARNPGGFYQEEVEFFDKNGVFDVYFAIDEETISKELLKTFFRYIENTGFGRNKSTGRGRFEIEIVNDDHHGFQKNTDKHNAFMTLSACCPAKNDPTEGFYDLTVKFGRLGGDYAKRGIPFKKAITMLKAGSVFLSDNSLHTYVGQLLGNVHERYPQIRHYAFAMTYPFTLNEEVIPCLI